MESNYFSTNRNALSCSTPSTADNVFPLITAATYTMLVLRLTCVRLSDCKCVTMVDYALSEVAYMQIVFLRVYDSAR